MNKLIRFIQNYLLIGFPFVIACMLWETIQSPNETATGFAKVVWNLLGFNLIFWFTILLLFLVILVIVPSVRNKTLNRLAHIQERDEREQYITGKAAKTTYISTLSLMMLLLALSILSVKVAVIPKVEGVHPRSVNVSIGVHIGFLNKIRPEKKSEPGEKVLFDSTNTQLSPAAILVILLAWQLVIFNLAARREQS